MLLYNHTQISKTKMATQEQLNQEHSYIAARVPESTILSEHEAATHLGSYMLHAIQTGDFIPVNATKAFEADFDNIEALDARAVKEGYATFANQLATDNDKLELRDVLQQLPERQKELFTAAVYATEAARNFFTNKEVNREARDKHGWLPLDPERQDSYALKKLSETSDAGLCVEYSLFVGKVMQELGQQVDYTVGYRQQWPDEEGIYHAMLTADNGKILIDPLLIAQTQRAPVPFGLYQAQGEGMVENTQDKQRYADAMGRSMTYSASPLPAQEMQW